MIRRLATPDFMFGQVLVPPPSTGTKETMDAGDVLSCFTETGSPAISELSPIAMVCFMWLVQEGGLHVHVH